MSEDKRLTDISTIGELQAAYNASCYFIAGVGGDVDEWIEGYEKWLADEEIGKPVGWLRTTGAAVNFFAGSGLADDGYFPLDLTCLMFPLHGLHLGKLAIFKIAHQDRWFDDVIDNMRR